MRSLSEIETTVKRATKAIGFDWGISEEVGKSVRLLEMFGFSGIKNINQYYKDRTDKKFENISLISNENQSSSNPFCPIILGVSFLDQVKTINNIGKIKFDKIAFPLIFLSFLSRSSEVIGKKIIIRFDKKEFLLNLNVNIYSNLFNQDFPTIAKNVEIEFIDNQDNFKESEWQNLYRLSENTFVEESESLKQGAAGAGLTDND